MNRFALVFQAERIKWRKDWTLLAALLAPFTQVLFLLLITWFSENRVRQFGAGFIVWYKINFIAWNLVFMPITVALVAVLSWDLEERSRAWNHLLVQPIPCLAHYMVKCVSHLSLLLIAHVILVLLLVIGGVILRANVPLLAMGAIRPEMVFRFAGYSLVATLPVVALHAWLSTRFPGLGIGLVTALGGTWLTIQLADNLALVSLIPWGMASQIVGIALKGKLPDWNTYAGSLFCAMSLLVLGALDFKRRLDAQH